MAEDVITRPDGRSIVVSEERWANIIDGHPELADWRHLILSTLAQPDRVLPGRRNGEEWLYTAGGPSRWLKVVVQWSVGGRGAVITAFARRRLP